MSWARWIFAGAILFGVTVPGFSPAGHSASTAIPPLATKAQPKIIPKKEFVKMMPQIAKWLGVTCGYCHVAGDFSKMTGKKRIALFMRDEFVAKLQTRDGRDVTCFTCHQGKARFLGETDK